MAQDDLGAHLWSILILAWAIGGRASSDCARQSTNLNQSACEPATGIGVALVLFSGFVGFVFFSLIWFMTLPKGRESPVLRPHRQKGADSCGYDFAAQHA